VDVLPCPRPDCDGFNDLIELAENATAALAAGG